jgi:hypothetical protein
MLPEIEYDIDNSTAYFAWCRERARVIATSPYRASSVQNAIDRASHPNGHARDTSGERLPVVGFDEEVYVVALHREVNQAKPRPSRARKSAANGGKDRLPTQTRERAFSSQRHVDRLPSMVCRALPMARGRPAARAACALALPAPARGKRQLSLV